jgi:hypothetical protein
VQPPTRYPGILKFLFKSNSILLYLLYQIYFDCVGEQINRSHRVCSRFVPLECKIYVHCLRSAFQRFRHYLRPLSIEAAVTRRLTRLPRQITTLTKYQMIHNEKHPLGGDGSVNSLSHCRMQMLAQLTLASYWPKFSLSKHIL